MKKKKKQQPTVFYLVWRSEKITWNWRRSKVTKKKSCRNESSKTNRRTSIKKKNYPRIKKSFFSPLIIMKVRQCSQLLLICGQNMSFAKCGNFTLILAINEKELATLKSDPPHSKLWHGWYSPLPPTFILL